jgi:DNA-directed RNA polymerase specialized sigma24 family protein
MAGRPGGTGRPAAALDPTGRTSADLAAFWDVYRRNVRRYAGHLLDLHRIPDGRVDVDDVDSIVYLNLHEQWPTVRHPAAFARARTRAAVFAALRAETRCGPALDTTPEEKSDSDDTTPDLAIDITGPDVGDEVAEQDIRDRFDAVLPEAMAMLTDQQRRAVELCDAQERRRADAAAEMGVSVGAVNVHRDRGLRKLYEALRPVVGVAAFAAVIAIGIAAARALFEQQGNAEPAPGPLLPVEPAWAHLIFTLAVGLAMLGAAVPKTQRRYVLQLLRTLIRR